MITREKCLELAREAGGCFMALHTNGDTAYLSLEQLESLVRASVCLGLEMAKTRLDNSMIGFGSDGEWAEGYIQAARDISEGIAQLAEEVQRG